HVHLALGATDKAVVLVHGGIADQGPAAELRDDPVRVERAYLGAESASARTEIVGGGGGRRGCVRASAVARDRAAVRRAARRHRRPVRVPVERQYHGVAYTVLGGSVTMEPSRAPSAVAGMCGTSAVRGRWYGVRSSLDRCVTNWLRFSVWTR